MTASDDYSEDQVTTFQHLVEVADVRGATFIVLIDPDKLPLTRVGHFVGMCEEAGVDALFLGGSLMMADELDNYARRLKELSTLPVVGFPGSLRQVTGYLDAILYLSVISGRNPDLLFGQHVHAAPMIRRLGLETIPTGYMLVEAGRLTTAQYMTNSLPLPRGKPEIAAATALAAEMLGMGLLYVDGGSGARELVPEEIVSAISEACSIPLTVGGGLKQPKDVTNRVRAGARFVVVGTAIEQRPDLGYVRELTAAAHVELKHTL
jgi:putative glycerol-1-phosphate prenyltransferase